MKVRDKPESKGSQAAEKMRLQKYFLSRGLPPNEAVSICLSLAMDIIARSKPGMEGLAKILFGLAKVVEEAAKEGPPNLKPHFNLQAMMPESEETENTVALNATRH